MTKSKSSDLFILNAIVMFLTFISGSYLIFFVALAFLDILNITIFFVKNRFNFFDDKSLSRLCTMNFIVSFFIIVVVARNFNLIQSVISISVIIYTTLRFVFYFVVLLKNNNLKFNKTLAYNLIWFCGVVLIIFAFNYTSFLGYAKYDSAEYYYPLSEINIFNFNTIEALKLCNHVSMSYSIMIYISYCVVGNLYYAAIAFNLIMILFTFYSMKTILKKVFCDINSNLNNVLSLVFVCLPLISGMSASIYLDCAMMFGLMFMLAAVFKGDRDLIFLSTVFAIFTKEFAIFNVAILIALPVIIDFIKSIESKEFKKFIRENLVYILSLLALLVVFIVAYLSGLWSGWHEFGLNMGHIAIVLLNLFAVNFQYLFVIISLITMIFYFKKIKASNEKINLVYLQMGLIFIVHLILNLVVITWPYYRYELCESLIITVIALIGICKLFIYVKENNLIHKRNIFISLVAIVSIISSIQCFTTIDPLMLISKNKMNTGTNLYSVIQGFNYSDGMKLEIFDSSVYNNQLTFYDLAFDKILKEVDYSSNVVLLSDAQMFDVGFRTGYDNKTNKRYYTTNVSELISVKQLSKEVESLDESKTYYFVETSDKQTPIEKLSQYFDVGESYTAKSLGWSFRVTALEIK